MNDKELTDKQINKFKIIRIIIQVIVILAVIGAAIFLTVKLLPYFIRINKDEEFRLLVLDKIESYGGFSWAIIILAQILQTVVAVIPSGPIVMIAGMMYDPFVSIVLCVVGQTLGSLITFFLVKLLGVRFIALFFDPEKLKESKLLKNETRSEVLIFGYLLIPALPKDIVSFIAPFTKIKWYKFGLISFFARIPMTIVTVFMGSSLLSGTYTIAIVLGCFSALLALLCFIFNNKIVLFLDKIKNRKQENKD